MRRFRRRGLQPARSEWALMNPQSQPRQAQRPPRQFNPGTRLTQSEVVTVFVGFEVAVPRLMSAWR